MKYDVNIDFLQTGAARRIGFKPLRFVSLRERSEDEGTPSPALPNSLALALQQGFITAICPAGLPLLVGSNHAVYEFNMTSETFVASDRTFDTVQEAPWGCVAPIFGAVVKNEADPTVTSLASTTDDGIGFQSILNTQVDELREITEPTVASGFIKDASHFNNVLSRPITLNELSDPETFVHIFPEDDQEEEGLFSALGMHKDDDAGRIIISYRHQEYARNRITFDDWTCAVHSIKNVVHAYGWTRTRFWTDARLRQYARKTPELKNFEWAEVGLDPYLYGPVVVLNLSRKQSISDRFWLTVERKTGAHYFGTWLTDDTGDSVYYAIPKGDELYSRAIVTSVGTSQGITWASDREQVLELEWDQLGVTDVEQALRMLREPMTFEAREDFVDEDIREVTIAEKGATLCWCGDVEALVDPPALAQVFGAVGEVQHDTVLTVIETEVVVEDTTITSVMFQERNGDEACWIAKRLYVDKDGEIRARSVPRLVDEDYAQSLAKQPEARIVDLENTPPKWLSASMKSGG
ncbi:hypothetical protein FGB62_169g233 [Gracilaria domingensis]|nr:hypothetical protein FGB62_169g233 [Gracilaria domingensis]